MLQKVDVCICGKPVLLHRRADGRALDCAHAFANKGAALADAAKRLGRIEGYIARIVALKGK